MLKDDWHPVVAFIVDPASCRIRLAWSLDYLKVQALATLPVATQATFIASASELDHFLVFFGGFFVFLP